MTERSLVVLSNRLPVAVRTTAGRTRIERAPGGLDAALEPALQRRGGTWVGWPGGIVPEGVELAPDAGYRIAPVQLTPTDVQRFYLGFSNRTLWPLLHSFPARMEISRDEWITYEKVNRRFADVVDAQLDGSELVWIHDYQLMRGLLACDLVGFHCQAYASNFLDCAERMLGARVERDAGRIEHGERMVRVGAFPLGIDRLDYTKGIPEKIRSFERLLELYPQHRERVVLLQVAEPSRGEVGEYRRLKREVDGLVGSVNGSFGTSRWTPIRYLNRSVSPEDLSRLYRDADVALVTPLRDGMILVAKEYVACQVHEPGVLVLSRLTGAAETMHEALRVNPYDIDGVAHFADRTNELAQALRSAAEPGFQARDAILAVEARLPRGLGQGTRRAEGAARPLRSTLARGGPRHLRRRRRDGRGRLPRAPGPRRHLLRRRGGTRHARVAASAERGCGGDPAALGRLALAHRVGAG